ncbi:glycine--tRNA ligase subunit beta [Wenxinia marina]|uniref:Glycine--tRNA ligase beta subunit n=1 Tax=Wenxinia marina DSM 24838 TaxID=1123501 RepID=A0A0D0Q406_9RHOB|nr:glycine--tRNA ligase subunit beta [Wenxinia marina]KIQ69229.1 glycyl-tRNA synthetase beta chain [Wenxinia marina DSM 24838]GGL71298.1 glycine--tRNA ligase beta subunit [Wenxinia marina]
MPDLLIELFSEEIPARMQARASDDLKRLMTDGLVEAGLTYASAAAFATPRRLTLSVEGLTAESRATREERKGPAVGAPDAAVDGFARSAGVARNALEVRDVKKGQAYFAVIETPGRTAAEIVAEVLERTIRTFPWPKSMRWGAGRLRWVRPLQSILCLLAGDDGAEVVPLEVDGLKAGATTRGHRFMAPDAFAVSSFDDYEAKLKRARVLLRPEERAETIRHDAANLAFARGLEVVEDEGLLAEVAGLVEWPVVLMGRIGEDFLGLPAEVLRTSMKEHQKFFSVRNPKSGRIEGYVTVANIETSDDGATILAGNGKVLAARLSDARFFWENDLAVAKAGMDEWRVGLKAVTFESRLGSQADRIARVAALAREIAPMVGADPDLAETAAQVAKLDLRSEMVGEFPELQGTMGRYYAEAAGLPAEVAAASAEHYSPLGPSDAVPTAPVSVAVALADKLDTLTGFWAIDEKPTGSKDPFALRRAALGVVRLILDQGHRLNIFELIQIGIARHPTPTGHLASDVQSMLDDDQPHIDAAWSEARDLLSFLHDRLKVHLRDEGIRHDVIDACLAMPGADDLTLLVRRAEALAAFLKTEDGGNLVQGFRRANNILTQAEEKDGVEYSYGADRKFAEADEERALFDALDAAEAKIGPAMQAENFAAAMAALADLRAPIDAFFEAVQVNAEAQVVRRNRLNLLSRIRRLCLDVADLRRLEG